MSAACFSGRVMPAISPKSWLHSSGMNSCGVNWGLAPRISREQHLTSKLQPVAWKTSTNRCSSGRQREDLMSSPLPIVVLAGARPNFMKVAPLMEVLSTDHELDPILVHTGQHYDHNMSGQFLKDLGLPEARYNLRVGCGTHDQQTGEVMKRLEPILVEEGAAAILVVGDVNSTMAGALAAAKLGIQIVHVEAGLRSFDRTMPEEINRIVTDSISDLLLVTEESGRVNLLHEGIALERINF